MMTGSTENGQSTGNVEMNFGKLPPHPPENLVLINETMTWNQALKYCRRYGGDLVSIHDEEIQHWVEEKVKLASTAHVWLGLRFTCVLNFWFWVSAETRCYQNWAPGNGSGIDECGKTGAMESAGRYRWVSLSETEKLNFICCNCESRFRKMDSIWGV
ncbi:low affinity immunoglobulin epsilon Fc receptor-like isoform X7 [Brienomyrus brachyistius]|uniref:low affinity immunoglobulin epsilon Fc receptor-like isoform X1 n=1 Tax=Brienomyrus brachyistius TaxID=42636 RepID=UPI0020B1E868|nr:low affinity immunoglobulin epsilon Fc receptor-like isoform X1 [Brienomyrus brachyistius]XP_048866071.1 low affinity immunoglobulin epsilon Fc receptor-like isoform X2 [Brienomyrus brachyistius]XP_048866072.1 low affinity immunoglobulin epsilon Fc receptor-like isoform X3 [Brienomyrus brachyistius]XP_048866073.1 low affinity immunoglobulin epsilon Fc receptor-like isoform X4 [Brienomyrus brachyistius]XP_048866074.1 low affinity immunoglobulin epsilon Fc receptor-like isoform X5 [Brienomyrus